MAGLNRRHFLRTAGLAGAVLGTGLGTSTPALARSATETATPGNRATNTAGTTLRSAAAAESGAGYRRLADGPGWPLVVRPDLVAGAAARDDRRVPVMSFVQFTDLHLVDSQSPGRFEYLHPLMGAGAFRPHETLGAHAAARLVRRVNELPCGPVTGRDFDFVISTGDNTDNHEHAELGWLLTVLNGGQMQQNTGDPARYEGVQNSGAELYWHPNGEVRDQYREKGFPLVPGLLDAAVRPFDSPGLRVPWYVTFGNHDDSVVGTLPSNLVPESFYTGSHKIVGCDERHARELDAALRDPDRSNRAAALLTERHGVERTVTPDGDRKPFTTAEFIRAHLDPAQGGPGPVGHGFSEDSAASQDAFYTFRVAPGVTGISLDSTNTAGFADGSLGLGQYRWLEQVLTRGSSRYYDVLGRPQHQHVSDELFVLFSHHTSSTMGALLPDDRHPDEVRVDGHTVVRLLHRFPNLLAWVNGHSHRNAITPHPADEPERGFWEINTASHVDYPQLARVIELADNQDGTLSLFTTLLEADSPYAADYGDRSPAALASLYRELSYNDPHADLSQLGEVTDRNAELLVPGRLPTR